MHEDQELTESLLDWGPRFAGHPKPYSLPPMPDDAVRERDENLTDKQRSLFAMLDSWWQRDLESRA